VPPFAYPEFKAEIVELCQRSDRSIGQVANYFDLIQTAVRGWVKRAERDAGTWRDGEPCPMDSRRLTGNATMVFTRPTPPAPRPWARISPRSARLKRATSRPGLARTP
jgi:transposase-like protein